MIESGSCPVGTVVRRNIVSFILTSVIVLSDVSSLIFHSCLVRLRHGIMSNEAAILEKIDSAFKTLNGRLNSTLEEIRDVRNSNVLLCERIKRLEITKSELEELPSGARGR